MSTDILIAVIIGLIAAHNAALVWEIRKLRSEISSLRDQVNSAALAAAQAAVAAATMLANVSAISTAMKK